MWIAPPNVSWLLSLGVRPAYFVPTTKHKNARFQVIIDVELLGFVYHWGLEVNSITVIGEF